MEDAGDQRSEIGGWQVGVVDDGGDDGEDMGGTSGHGDGSDAADHLDGGNLGMEIVVSHDMEAEITRHDDIVGAEHGSWRGSWRGR